jgi:hypothetical protein
MAEPAGSRRRACAALHQLRRRRCRLTRRHGAVAAVTRSLVPGGEARLLPHLHCPRRQGPDEGRWGSPLNQLERPCRSLHPAPAAGLSTLVLLALRPRRLVMLLRCRLQKQALVLSLPGRRPLPPELLLASPPQLPPPVPPSSSSSDKSPETIVLQPSHPVIVFVVMVVVGVMVVVVVVVVVRVH